MSNIYLFIYLFRWNLAVSPGFKQHSVSMKVGVGSHNRSETSPLGSEQQNLFHSNERDIENKNETNRSCKREEAVVTTVTTVTSGSAAEGEKTKGSSFIGSSGRVTGVQDIICRMRAADNGQ